MEIGKFGFIVHPTEMSYLYRKWPVLRYLPEPVIDAIVRLVPPVDVAHATGIESQHNRAEGWFYGVPLSAKQMMQMPAPVVLRKIIAAVRRAERAGAKVVGLGAFTKVVGDAGITVAHNSRVAITTGNSYTVAAALEGAKEGARRMGTDFDRAEVAVVGANGSIGAACARILAREARYLTLVGRSEEKLESLARQIVRESGLTPRISTDIAQSLPRADVVIAVSSAVDAIIQPEHLKPGSVVCDVAQPRDVDERVAAERDDVLVMDGGVISIPGAPDFGFDFGFPAGTAMACMAETMLLALENRYESFSLGRDLSVEQIDEISRLAKKHDFRVAGIRSFHRTVDDQVFDRIRANAVRRRAAAAVS